MMMRQRQTLVIVLIAIFQQGSRASHKRCRPCPNPEDDYDSSLFDREVEVPGFGVASCGTVSNALVMQGFLDADNPTCPQVQSLGTYCGCPVQPDACQGLTVCGDEFDPLLRIENFNGMQDYNTNCALVQSWLQSFTEGTEECTKGTAQYATACGCAPGQVDIFEKENDGKDGDDDKDLPIIKVGAHTGFSLCPQGGEMAFADKDLTKFVESHEISFPTNDALDCATFDAATRAGIIEDSYQTYKYRFFIAGLCGCPPIDNACEFCPTNDIDPSKGDLLVNYGEALFGATATCNDGDALSQFQKTDELCWAPRTSAWLCGCNGGTPWYLGADTERQHKVLAWIPRVSGFFSLMGSVYIIQDILRQRRKASSTGLSTYHMILLGMSFFDISSSVAWIVSTWALPEYNQETDTESGVYGAKGNEATCKTQGFFLEAGFVGSTAFTACLTTFYLLTIVYGYREGKMKSLQKYFVTIPTLLAVALACAAIPQYRAFYVACFVRNPNSESDVDAKAWKYLIIFSILPVGISMLITLGNMAAIVQYVFKTSQRANKWRLAVRATSQSSMSFSTPANGPPSTLSQSARQLATQGGAPPRSKWTKAELSVFWQAVSYVVAFLLTWVIYLIGQFKPYFSGDDNQLYAFWVTLLVLNPLMGFWNAFVYVKPWTWKGAPGSPSIHWPRRFSMTRKRTSTSQPTSWIKKEEDSSFHNPPTIEEEPALQILREDVSSSSSGSKNQDHAKEHDQESRGSAKESLKVSSGTEQFRDNADADAGPTEEFFREE